MCLPDANYANFNGDVRKAGQGGASCGNLIELNLGILGHKPVNPCVVILHGRFIPAVNK